MEKYGKLLKWEKLSKKSFLTEAFIDKHVKTMDWEFIATTLPLSYDFIKKHIHRMNIHFLQMNDKVHISTAQWGALVTLKRSRKKGECV